MLFRLAPRIMFDCPDPRQTVFILQTLAEAGAYILRDYPHPPGLLLRFLSERSYVFRSRNCVPMALTTERSQVEDQ